MSLSILISAEYFFYMHTVVCYIVEFFSFILPWLQSYWVFEKVHLICTLLRNSRTPRVIEEQGRWNKLYISQGAVPPCFHWPHFRIILIFLGPCLKTLPCHFSEKYMKKGRQMKGDAEDAKEGWNAAKSRQCPSFPLTFSPLVLGSSWNMRCEKGKKVLGS